MIQARPAGANKGHPIAEVASGSLYGSKFGPCFDTSTGDALPQYASADTRLGKFRALTYGLKYGMPFNEGSEFNVRIEYYDQHGNGSPSNAIGQLRQQNLFPDLKAVMVMLGYSFSF